MTASKILATPTDLSRRRRPSMALIAASAEALRFRGPCAASESDGHEPLSLVAYSLLTGTFRRRKSVESHVRTALIVVSPPGLGMSLRLGSRCEPVQVQAFVSERAVERLDVRIVGRSSRPREVHAHLVMVSPEIDDLPGELGAIEARLSISARRVQTFAKSIPGGLSPTAPAFFGRNLGFYDSVVFCWRAELNARSN